MQGGLHSRYEHCDGEKKVLSLPGNEPRLPGRPACSLVAGPTALVLLLSELCEQLIA
jgi:hypothetical protein